MKLIIAGSRDWVVTPADIELQFDDFLFCKQDVTEVVSGTAKGADFGGELWARENGLLIKRFPADWEEYGKAAGKIRNGKMAKYADAAIVFWKNQSSGSANMIAHMAALQKPVRVVRPCR